MMNVWKIIPIIFVVIVLTISARAQSLPDLPKFPISPLSKADYDGLAKSDNQEGWKALAERSRKTATEYFKKQLYDESASWVYTGYAAEMFAEHDLDSFRQVWRCVRDFGFRVFAVSDPV